ncbi:MAG: hypothetical protein OHK0047_38870 [Leptolyngbyaceae cyanobacterium]|uniref:hypothetical protein n=1 Tax=Leptodesmis TaxID=2664261 RepID=UPI001F2F88F4|nr:hypothetical protein [Leptodesmis sichuanensis]UIE36277.1 hypothetical protein KIK02_14520 [Leptodesmis sichuanensis A121]
MSRNPHPDSEEALENAVIDLFGKTLEWETINAYDEDLGSSGTLGRETRDEVVLVRYLRSALQDLNPNGVFTIQQVNDSEEGDLV